MTLAPSLLANVDYPKKSGKTFSLLGDDFVEIENGAGHGGPGSVPGQVERLVTPGFAELQ